MATDVRHVNISDVGGKVYCYKVYDVIELDGPHLSTQCWVCPFWAGLAGGYGVECMYEDDKVMNGVEVVKFRNPEDAKDHAPKKVSNLDGAASKFGVKANDARAELIGKEKIEAEPAEVPVETVPVETAPGPVLTAIGGPTSEEAAVEMATEAKHLPMRHDQKTHAGRALDHLQTMLDLGPLSRTSSVALAGIGKQIKNLNLTDIEDKTKTKLDNAYSGLTKEFELPRGGRLVPTSGESIRWKTAIGRMEDALSDAYSELQISGRTYEGKSKIEKMHDMTMHEEGVCPHCGVEMKDGKCPECGFDQEVGKSETIMIQASFAAEIVPGLAPEMKSLLVENGDKFVDLDALIAKAKKGNGMSAADPGLFTRCVEKNKNRKGLTDVNSYCASVHQKITGMWPGEHGGKNKMGPEKSHVEAVVEEVIKALQK